MDRAVESTNNVLLICKCGTDRFNGVLKLMPFLEGVQRWIVRMLVTVRQGRQTATRRVTLAKTDPRSDLGRYVELDPESGLIGISSSSSI